MNIFSLTIKKKLHWLHNATSKHLYNRVFGVTFPATPKSKEPDEIVWDSFLL